MCEGVSWQDTLIKVLPVRKGAHLCDAANNISSILDNSIDSDTTN